MESGYFYQRLSMVCGIRDGFLQGVLLFGIALISAVLGGLALVDRAPKLQTHAEKVRLDALVILKKAIHLESTVVRKKIGEGKRVAAFVEPKIEHSNTNRMNTGQGFVIDSALDQKLILIHLSQEVCASIDNMLYGFSEVPKSPLLEHSGTRVTDALGWNEGCVQTKDNTFVYYKTVQEK